MFDFRIVLGSLSKPIILDRTFMRLRTRLILIVVGLLGAAAFTIRPPERVQSSRAVQEATNTALGDSSGHSQTSKRLPPESIEPKRIPQKYKEVFDELPPNCLTGFSDYLDEQNGELPTHAEATQTFFGDGNERVGQPILGFPIPKNPHAPPTSTPDYSQSNQPSAAYPTSSPQPMQYDSLISELAQATSQPATEPYSGSSGGQQNPIQFYTATNFNPHIQARSKDDPQPQMGDCEVDPHAEAFKDTPFPSATECAKCHEQIFQEWALSSHAYAGISPMFHKFEQRINDLSQGTIGYFCYRCHAPIGIIMGLRRDQPIWTGPRVFREGVTCVACHRVKEHYGKANGERRIEPGTIYDPVYGAGDGLGVAQVIRDKDQFKVSTDRNEKNSQAIHRRAVQFEELSKETFCMSCHQVAVHPNIKLEVVWDQYVASPAYRDGVTCQDCHMGRVPGKNEGYSIGPVAVISGKTVDNNKKHSNHIFYGPGGSIAHPGVFPHNPKADRWTMDQWLLYDWRAGWGTDPFEQAVEAGQVPNFFPEPWQNADDRYDARDILEENFKKLRYKNDLRRQVMENGSHIDGPFFEGCEDCNGRPLLQTGKPLKFHYQVKNTNPGHNMPSGSLGAQPQLWLNVVLIDPTGRRVWESGYLDSIGDLADLHSQDVVHGKVPLDKQLFNLQTKFLITNVKGTDRETFLPVNTDIDQLPFIRPAGQATTVMNHPPFIRMEGHSIPPLGCRDAKYVIPGDCIQMPGQYRLSVRMRTRLEPIYFMRFVFATKEMERMMNEGIVDFHNYTVTFTVQ